MKWSELTKNEVEELREDQPLVLVPVAAVEQHGPHLPLDTDWVILESFIDAALDLLPSISVLQLPTHWLGMSSYHWGLAGTLTASDRTIADSVGEIIRSVWQSGFRRVLILNGHGGNRAALRMVVNELAREEIRVGFHTFRFDAASIAEICPEDRSYVHGGDGETSVMLHIAPDRVQIDRLTPDQMTPAGSVTELSTIEHPDTYFAPDLARFTNAGFNGNPAIATADKGKRLHELATASIVQAIEAVDKELPPSGTTS